MSDVDITIIGAGAVGLSIAYWLRKLHPEREVFVLEKESTIGEGQTGRSSGVIHSGHFFTPGTLKAKLCVEGNPLIKEFSQKYDVPCATTGKLTVATNKEEEKQLEHLLKNSRANNVKGIVRMVSSDEVRAMEPNVRATSALYTEVTGIVDAGAYVRTLDKVIQSMGAFSVKNSRVVSVEPNGSGFTVGEHTSRYESGTFTTNMVINAAGLAGDYVGKMINPSFPHEVKPLMGEFMKMNKNARPELHMNGLNVYPVPRIVPGVRNADGSPKYMSGVHLTPQFEYDSKGEVVIGNTVLVGPFSHSTDTRWDYSQRTKSAQDFFEAVQPFFPGIRVEDLQEDYVGIQVKLKDYDDFVLQQDATFPGAYHCIASSPGLTSSLAIGKYVVERILEV